MRIGFLGNSNNYPFRLAKALRALGHEVVFFVDRPPSEPRNRPESHDVDVLYPYPDWIREIEPLHPRQIVLYPWTIRPVLRTLERCDGVVLNGFGLSLGRLISRPIIGLLTGSDLDVYANPRFIDFLAASPSCSDQLSAKRILKYLLFAYRRMLFTRFVRLQRAGIAKCCLVEYAVPGLLPEGDALLKDIGIEGSRRTSFMITDLDHLPAPSSSDDGTFRIFCSTRLQWNKPESGSNISPLDLKGTDVMLKGLQMFLAHSRRPVQIRLISVGAEVESAKRYVNELGLAPYVLWHPQLTQVEFLDELASADVVLENFGPGGCIGMAGRDAIAMGKPLIAWGKSAVFERSLGELLPIYEAQTPDDICARLNELVDDSVGIAAHSSRARLFAERWFSARRAAERCVAVFEEERKGSLNQ